jgi:hypothetical protein
MGHDDELNLQGSDTALNRYLDAIERLRDAGWRRIFVVTDHGYIHWTGADERNVPHPAPDPAYLNRRALAYPAATPLEGPQGLAPGGRWRIAFPRGAASFRAYGGLGYFHGGASLQEWIIPCVAVEWPQQARPVAVTLAPLPRILSQRPKVTLHVAPGSLLREDTIPRQVEVVIRHTQTRAILFRTANPVMATGDEPQIELPLSLQPGVVAERGAPLRIEVRDPRTEDVLHAVDSQLMTELSGW